MGATRLPKEATEASSCCPCIAIQPDRSASNRRGTADRMDRVELNSAKAHTTRSRCLVQEAIGSVGGIHRLSCRRKLSSAILSGAAGSSLNFSSVGLRRLRALEHLCPNRTAQHQYDKTTTPAIFPVVGCRGHGEMEIGMGVMLYKTL